MSATITDERLLVFSYAKIAQDTIREDMVQRHDLPLSVLLIAGQVAQLLAYENDLFGLYPKRVAPTGDLNTVADYLRSACVDALFDESHLTHTAMDAVLRRTEELIEHGRP
ncbi:hypothetical protein FB459_2221 [Yimella lutea]|uniref:Uncharacterized protein n=1 Tax=Yimella lutea TaxID=587872 RepID=A0A542EHA8_9MICO|nr:hypothetical protein [Yimella lutea]TQJ14720.1 hypothetical protein FB459_2221 [Yimella lutea]